MRSQSSWAPTKFKRHRDGWRASLQTEHVGIGSRITVDIVAQVYSRVIARFATGKILDLGSGAVPLYGMYEHIDSNPMCVDWPASAHSTAHVDLFADLNRPLPFDSASFDTVLITDVLEHLHSPGTVVSECGRVLRPGGTVIGGTPFVYALHETPHDYCRHTEYSLARLISLAGMEPIVIAAYGSELEVALDLICRKLRPRPLQSAFTHITSSMLRALGRGDDELGLKGSQTLPLGYLFVAQA